MTYDDLKKATVDIKNQVIDPIIDAEHKKRKRISECFAQLSIKTKQIANKLDSNSHDLPVSEIEELRHLANEIPNIVRGDIDEVSKQNLSNILNKLNKTIDVETNSLKGNQDVINALKQISGQFSGISFEQDYKSGKSFQKVYLLPIGLLTMLTILTINIAVERGLSICKLNTKSIKIPLCATNYTEVQKKENSGISSPSLSEGTDPSEKLIKWIKNRQSRIDKYKMYAFSNPTDSNSKYPVLKETDLEIEINEFISYVKGLCPQDELDVAYKTCIDKNLLVQELRSLAGLETFDGKKTSAKGPFRDRLQKTRVEVSTWSGPNNPNNLYICVNRKYNGFNHENLVGREVILKNPEIAQDEFAFFVKKGSSCEKDEEDVQIHLDKYANLFSSQPKPKLRKFRVADMYFSPQ